MSIINSVSISSSDLTIKYKADPNPPPIINYECSGGTCNPSKTGPFNNKSDCEKSCPPPAPPVTTYACASNECVLTKGGEYSSLSICNTSCPPSDTLPNIMKALSATFTTNNKDNALITKSLADADTLYKSSRSSTPPSWDPTGTPDNPTLDGSSTTQTVILQYKLTVLSQGVAKLDFVNRTSINPSGNIFTPLLLTTYGNTNYKFDNNVFTSSVNKTPFLLINYIGMKKKSDRTTTTITPDEYEIAGIIDGITIKFDYIIRGTYNSSELWGLELTGKNDKNENLYRLHPIKDTSKIILKQNVASFEDVKDTLSDHANGSIINVCRSALNNDDVIVFPNSLSFAGAYWDITAEKLNSPFNLYDIKSLSKTGQVGTPTFSDYGTTDATYYSQFADFNIKLQLIASPSLNQTDTSYIIDKERNILVRTFNNSKFNCIFDITPKASTNIHIDGIINEIDYIGYNDIYDGSGTQFSFDGSKPQNTIINFKPTTDGYSPTDFIVYPLITSSVNSTIQVELNALNNVPDDKLLYSVGGNNNLVYLDPNGDSGSGQCPGGFWPGCNGGNNLWDYSSIQSSCNNLTTKPTNYGVLQTSNTGPSNIINTLQTDGVYLKNQIILTRLRIEQEITQIESMDIYIGLDENFVYSSSTPEITVGVVNIEYPWQTEMQYNEWGKYMHDWGFNPIIAVPVGSYNQEVPDTASSTYKGQPVTDYTGYIKTEPLDITKLSTSKFTKYTVEFDKSKIYDGNLNVNSANSFILVRSNVPIRLRTYVRWNHTSDVYVLNYLSLPTKPTQVVQSQGVQETFLKFTTDKGAAVSTNPASPYSPDNITHDYKDLPDIGTKNKFGFYNTWSDVPVLGQTFAPENGLDDNLCGWTCVQTPHIWETQDIATATCCVDGLSKCGVGDGTDNFDTCSTFDPAKLTAFKDKYYLQPDKDDQITYKGGCFAVGVSTTPGVPPHHSTCYEDCTGSQGQVWNTGDTSYCTNSKPNEGTACKWCNPPQEVSANPPKACDNTLPICTACNKFKTSPINGADKTIGSNQSSHLSYGIGLPISAQTLGGFLPEPNSISQMGIYAVLNSYAKLDFKVEAPVLYNLPNKEWGNIIIPSLETDIVIFDSEQGTISEDYKTLSIDLYYILPLSSTSPPSTLPKSIITDGKINVLLDVYMDWNKDKSNKGQHAELDLTSDFKIQPTEKINSSDNIAYKYSIDIDITKTTVGGQNLTDYLKLTKRTQNMGIYVSYKNAIDSTGKPTDDAQSEGSYNFILLKNQFEFGFYNFHPIKDDPIFECYWNYYNFDLCSLFAVIPSESWVPTSNVADNVQLLVASSKSNTAGQDGWNSSHGATTTPAQWETYITGFNASGFATQNVSNTYVGSASRSPVGGGMSGITMGGAANSYSIPKWCNIMHSSPTNMDNFIDNFIVQYNIGYLEFDIETSFSDHSVNANVSDIFVWITKLQYLLKRKNLPVMRIYFGASAPIDINGNNGCNSNAPQQLKDYDYVKKNHINFIIYTYTNECTHPGKMECGNKFWWNFSESVINTYGWTPAQFTSFCKERVYFAVDTWSSKPCDVSSNANYIECQTVMSKRIQNNYAGLFIWAANTTFYTTSPTTCPADKAPIPDGSSYYSVEAFKLFVDAWDNALHADISDETAKCKTIDNAYFTSV